MGLLDDLQPVERVRACKVRDTANKLDPADAKILLEAANNPEWGFTDLVKALAARGIQLSDNSIRRHRFGTCACGSNA
jgi:hypothetical protein